MTERFICTAENPWTPEKAKRAQHPDAEYVSSCVAGCCSEYHCPHCHKIFWIEYPD